MPQGHKECQFSLWHQRSCLLVRMKAPYCTVTSIAGLCTHRDTHTQTHKGCVFTFACACCAHKLNEKSPFTSSAIDNRTVHTGLHNPYIWVCAKIKHLQHWSQCVSLPFFTTDDEIWSSILCLLAGTPPGCCWLNNENTQTDSEWHEVTLQFYSGKIQNKAQKASDNFILFCDSLLTEEGNNS